MRLLFASPFPYLPDNTSGREASTHALALRLRDAGHAVAAVAALPETDQRARASDETLGYPVYRAREPLLRYAEVLRDFRPDLAVLPLAPLSLPLAALGIERGVKAMLHATNVDPRNATLNLIARPELLVTANSPFTARRLDALHGVDAPTVLPLIEPDQYRTHAAGDAVLMANPTLLKGIEIFFRMAEARPAIPFIAVESWNLSDDWRLVLANRARALGNVELWPSTTDMRPAYARSRLVLMPSIYEETYGRIVAEAQVSGIPALASDRGALRETVGAGGLTLPVDAGIDAWLGAFDRLWDENAYSTYSAAARGEAAQPQRRPETVTERFLAVADAFLGGGSPH